MSARVSVRLQGPEGEAVAVKMATTPDEEAALTHEAAQLRRACHPGVVSLVGQVVTDDGAELHTRFAGEPLDRWRGTLAQLAGLGAAVAATLADLHEMGIVHGRLDGSHVLLGADGRPRLCGFSPCDDAEPRDDVAALARMLGSIAEHIPLSDRRGLLAWRRGPLAERRGFDQVVAHATDPVPTRRPSARAFATALLAAVTDAELPPTGDPTPAKPTTPPAAAPPHADSHTARATPDTRAPAEPHASYGPRQSSSRERLGMPGNGPRAHRVGDGDTNVSTSASPRPDPDQQLGARRRAAGDGHRVDHVHDGDADVPPPARTRPHADPPADARNRPDAGPDHLDRKTGEAVQLKFGLRPSGDRTDDGLGDDRTLPRPNNTPAGGTRRGRERRLRPGANHRPDDLPTSDDDTPARPGDDGDLAASVWMPGDGGLADGSGERDEGGRLDGEGGSLRRLPAVTGRRVGAPGTELGGEPYEDVLLIGGDADDDFTDPDWPGFDDLFGDQTEVDVDDVFSDRPWPEATDPTARLRRPHRDRSSTRRRHHRLLSRAAVLLVAAAAFTAVLAWLGTPAHREDPTDPLAAPDQPEGSAAAPDACDPTGATTADAEGQPDEGDEGTANENESTDARPDRGSDAGSGPDVEADVDGDGCPEPVHVEGGVVEVGGERWAIGRTDDQVTFGDWDCDGVATPAVYRPATGDVFVFASWAMPGQPLTVEPVAQVAGGRSLTTALTPTATGECDTPVVELATGAHHPVEVQP